MTWWPPPPGVTSLDNKTDEIMAKKNPLNGAVIDQKREQILEALAACREKEAALTKAGVQSGHAHYKSDRPHIMFILEPSKGGKRKHVYVGAKAENQARKLAEIDRWNKREQLRHSMSELERHIQAMDGDIQRTATTVSAVLEHAQVILEKHE